MTILKTPRVDNPAQPKYTPDGCSERRVEYPSVDRLAEKIMEVHRLEYQTEMFQPIVRRKTDEQKQHSNTLLCILILSLPVGIPSTFDPRPNPLTTRPPICQSSSGKVFSIPAITRKQSS